MDKYSKYKWNQNEFDALVSFAYNIGSIDGLTSSGSRSKDEIVDKFLAYNRAGGKILSGLTRRRQEERALFITSVHKEGWVKEDDRWRFYDNSGEYMLEMTGIRMEINSTGSMVPVLWSMMFGISTEVPGTTSDQTVPCSKAFRRSTASGTTWIRSVVWQPNQ